MTLVVLALMLGVGVGFLMEGGRVASTPYAAWFWRDALNAQEAKTALNSLGIALTGFSLLVLVIFLRAYPPRPWRFSPARLRIFTLVFVVGLSIGVTLWFEGDSLATLRVLRSYFPGRSTTDELAAFMSFVSVVLVIGSMLILGAIWTLSSHAHPGSLGRTLRLPNLSPSSIGKKLLVVFAAVFILLSAFHWIKGAPVADSLRMTVNDFRVAAKCPNKPTTVLRFVQRSTLESLGVGLAEAFGEDWVSQVCEGALSVSTTKLVSPPTRIDPARSQPIEPRMTIVPAPTRAIEVRVTPTMDSVKRGSVAWVGELEEQVHVLVNDERKKVGVKVLTLDQKLSDIARSHSVDMAISNYFEHENLRGQSPSERADNAGYKCRKDYGAYYTVGIAENIFQTWLYSSTTYMYGAPIGKDYMTLNGLATQIVDGWMNSPGHRQNILTLTYDRQGIGVAISKDEKVYVTQNFC